MRVRPSVVGKFTSSIWIVRRWAPADAGAHHISTITEASYTKYLTFPSSADFLGRLEPAIDDAPLQLFEPCAHAIHGLDALGALIGQALFGVHHEHPHAWFLCDNLRLGRCRLLAGRDADRTFDPGAGRALDIVEHLTTAAAIAANNVAMTIAAQVFEVLARHHAAVADKDDAF